MNDETEQNEKALVPSENRGLIKRLESLVQRGLSQLKLDEIKLEVADGGNQKLEDSVSVYDPEPLKKKPLTSPLTERLRSELISELTRPELMKQTRQAIKRAKRLRSRK